MAFRRGWAGGGALALAMIWTGAIEAKPAPPQTPPTVQAVLDCRKLTDDAARLACYDRAVTAMASAEQSGDLVSIDAQQRRAARRQAFGFQLPTLSFLERGEKPGELDKLDETLASAWQIVGDKWVFRMQDGAVWRQIDDEFLSRRPHPGSKIEIRRAMLGSYMLSVDGQPGLRVHRDE